MVGVVALLRLTIFLQGLINKWLFWRMEKEKTTKDNLLAWSQLKIEKPKSNPYFLKCDVKWDWLLFDLTILWHFFGLLASPWMYGKHFPVGRRRGDRGTWASRRGRTTPSCRAAACPARSARSRSSCSRRTRECTSQCPGKSVKMHQFQLHSEYFPGGDYILLTSIRSSAAEARSKMGEAADGATKSNLESELIPLPILLIMIKLWNFQQCNLRLPT